METDVVFAVWTSPASWLDMSSNCDNEQAMPETVTKANTVCGANFRVTTNLQLQV